MVSGEGSDVCELANQSRLGIQEGGFKETGAKRERFMIYRLDTLDGCTAWRPCCSPNCCSTLTCSCSQRLHGSCVAAINLEFEFDNCQKM